jgi:hypothetical protein
VNVAVVLGFMILMRIEGADHYTRTGSVPEARGPIPKGTSTPLSVMEDA